MIEARKDGKTTLIADTEGPKYYASLERWRGVGAEAQGQARARPADLNEDARGVGHRGRFCLSRAYLT